MTMRLTTPVRRAAEVVGLRLRRAPLRGGRVPTRMAPTATTRHFELTCAADRRAHRVDVDAFDAGIAAHEGRFRALCGHVVAVMSMSDPPAQPCRPCLQLAGHDAGPRRHRRGRA